MTKLHLRLINNMGSPFHRVLLLIIGFSLAVMLRISIGGVEVAHSTGAGLAFAFALLIMCVGAGFKTTWHIRVLWYGLLGTLVLCFPVMLRVDFMDGIHPAGNYLIWATVVIIVALVEELFLRGVLHDAIKRLGGEGVAVIVGAILFAALHIPLYGWHVVPLDLAVGLWLGMLRVMSRSWLAPGIAHVLTDIIAWWLV